jgi:voltage-gated potassium channel
VTSASRLRAGLLVLLLITIVGSVGYMVVEDLGAFDAVYMTVITLSTVGFREVMEDPSRAGQILTLALIATGTGTALYTAASAIEFGLERFLGGDRQQRRMNERIAQMNGHVILCGFGRVGKTAWQHLAAEGADVVVIDSDQARVAEAIHLGAVAIDGDATHDAILEAAGIHRAKVLISAVRSDSDNLVITLSAKATRPDLNVVARVLDAETEKKLFLAGADRVVAPQLVGGQRLAALALKPDLAEFIDLVVSGNTVEFQVEEFTVGAGSFIDGKSLREIDLRRKAGALVLAVGDIRGRLTLNPDPGLVFVPDQTVIGIGTSEQLDKLRSLMG